MSRNLKFTLAYDGTDFYGWQVQPGLPTVQGTLAECLAPHHRREVLPQGSGRTDAGVHALAQVASCRRSSRPSRNADLMTALNDSPAAVDPGDQRVESGRGQLFTRATRPRPRPTATAFIARDICPPFLARYVFHDPYPMNEEAMFRASEHVVGQHDFTSFAASDPDRSARMARSGFRKPGRGNRSFQRSDHSLRAVVRSTDEFTFIVRGDGFLHHMVRNLVGTFLQVGKGSLRIDDIAAILDARDRSAAGPTAAAVRTVPGQRGVLTMTTETQAVVKRHDR